MVHLMAAFVASFLLTMWVVRSRDKHAHISSDHDVSGPQKFHARPVPRIGGIGIFGGVLIGAMPHLLSAAERAMLPLLLLLASVPAFGAGIAEDLTKAQSPRRRLFFTAVAAALAVVLVDAVITHTDIPGLDWLFAFPLVAAVATIFAVAGVANAVNIIDGFNGLASMCCVIMLAGLAYVAVSVGDGVVAALALAGIGGIMGFFIWNFPAGLVFLGDGGAYFLGFYLAEAAVLLVHRNPTVSPMFALLLCIYPVFETVFSIYRKRFLRGMSPGVPDGIHLHMLVYKRLMRWAIGNRNAREMTRRNSMTSPYLWMLCSISVVPAVLWYDSTPVILGFILLFGVVYVLLYWRIVRFRSPRWLIFRARGPVRRR